MHMACQPKILFRDCGLASVLCLRMLTHCKESGMEPIHVSMRTTVPMNTSSSGVWLEPIYGMYSRSRVQALERADSRWADSGGSDSYVVILQ